jgi:hypothetical protein
VSKQLGISRVVLSSMELVSGVNAKILYVEEVLNILAVTDVLHGSVVG